MLEAVTTGTKYACADWADASPTCVPDLFKKADARSRKITPLLINPQFFFLWWENHESAVLMTSCYII